MFATAAALVALHTLTDTFLAPQQGTRWTDHLAAGLVPLALLVAAVMLFPHLRAGMRATAAVVVGVLALEGAALAVSPRRVWPCPALPGSSSGAHARWPAIAISAGPG